ncbi:MAG: mechanosensitive ion channel family protein [Lentisphaeria bacterium]|nr:mechanosensitive ion channel family protein [Lentisphaeria bacterium]
MLEHICILASSNCFSDFWENQQDNIVKFGKAVLLAIVVIVLAWLASKILKAAIIKAMEKIPHMDEAVGKILASISRVFIWLIAFLIVLDLFGVNTASILTVLGAAGLAIGLAMKDSLSNIAAGLMLLILRPYKIGDYVDCGSASGTIKEMGLFATKLETVDGVFISAPNNVVFGAPIKNYSRNKLRRADIVIGIAYGDSVTKAVEVLLAFMKENKLILQDPAPEVLVAEISNCSVNLNLRFWTNTESYWDAYWSVKAGLKTVIESSGLNLPLPQRVITVVNAPEAK